MPDDMRYYRLICLIAKAEIANKAEGILSERGIDVEYRMLVHGTASSEFILACLIQESHSRFR